MASNPVRGAADESVISMTSTEAQNGFGRVLDTVARNHTVLITRHNAAQAVVISFERYQELTRGEVPTLDALSAEFDELLAKMQRPEVQAAALEAFRASPEELARAAGSVVRAAAP
jgi:antitoxin Phd